jgi:gamma-glutamyl phosphate reductase
MYRRITQSLTWSRRGGRQVTLGKSISREKVKLAEGPLFADCHPRKAAARHLFKPSNNLSARTVEIADTDKRDLLVGREHEVNPARLGWLECDRERLERRRIAERLLNGFVRCAPDPAKWIFPPAQ